MGMFPAGRVRTYGTDECADQPRKERVEKLGPKLTMYVDDQRALEWTDPEPLEGGHIGFWSYQSNRPVIARAMVASDRSE